MNILNQSGIYKITCRPTGKVYVGSAAVLRKRRDKHWGHLRNGAHDNSHLQRAWGLYGPNAFVFEVLEVVADRQLLLEREQHWIDALDACRQGFNMMPATRNERYSLNLSPETRALASERMRGNMTNPLFRQKSIAARRKLLDEDEAYRENFVAKQRLAKQGFVWSADMRLKMAGTIENRKVPIVVMAPDGRLFEYLGIRSFCKHQFPTSWESAEKNMVYILNGQQPHYRGYRAARKGSPQEAILRASRPMDAPNWLLRTPNGETLELVGLAEFCNARGWRDSNLHKAQGGKTYKGYSVEWIGPARGEKRAFQPRQSDYVMWKGRAFTWVVTAPDGRVERTVRLSELCRANGLHQAAMSRVADGNQAAHKGWTCAREYLEIEAAD